MNNIKNIGFFDTLEQKLLYNRRYNPYKQGIYIENVKYKSVNTLVVEKIFEKMN
jgi:hypothetical protein